MVENRSCGYQTFPQHPNFILGDIRNKSLFDNIFSNYKISTVLHLAGQLPHVNLYKKSCIFKVIIKTHNFLKMKQYGVHQLIFASTAAVYRPMYYCLNKTFSIPVLPMDGVSYIVSSINVAIYLHILRLFNEEPSILLLGNHDPETHFIPLAIDAIIHQKILYFMGRTKMHLLVV